jgi:hypothetical protein
MASRGPHLARTGSTMPAVGGAGVAAPCARLGTSCSQRATQTVAMRNGVALQFHVHPSRSHGGCSPSPRAGPPVAALPRRPPAVLCTVLQPHALDAAPVQWTCRAPGTSPRRLARPGRGWWRPSGHRHSTANVGASCAPLPTPTPEVPPYPARPYDLCPGPWPRPAGPRGPGQGQWGVAGQAALPPAPGRATRGDDWPVSHWQRGAGAWGPSSGRPTPEPGPACVTVCV